MDVPEELLSSRLFQLESLRRCTRNEVEAVLQAAGITLREYWVFLCIPALAASNDPASGANQARLGETLRINASDIVRLLDTLVRKGWVSRHRDPSDRRRQLVALTEEGKATLQRLQTEVDAAEERALGEAKPKQLRHLRKLTESLLRRIPSASSGRPCTH